MNRNVLRPPPRPPSPSAHPSISMLIPGEGDPIDSPPPLIDHDTLSNLPDPSACQDDPTASLTDKGKAKEHPPTLPPLAPSPPVSCHIDDWSSSAPGPSSCRSTCPSLHTDSSSHSPSSSLESTIVQPDIPPALVKVTSRTRSLSNLSVHSATPSMHKFKIKLAASSKTPASLARKLLSRNKADLAGPSTTEPTNDLAEPLTNDPMSIDAADCPFPWQTRDNTRASSPRARVDAQVAPVATLDVTTVWSLDNHHSGTSVGSRGNRRSYSAPLPTTTFDVVPQSDWGDQFVSLSFHVRDLFDEMLPRELRLRVFSALISLHEADHERLKNNGKWSVLVASKHRWVGRNSAMRELVKLSRVSKLWRTLVFDGQLWQDVDLRAFPAPSSSFLASLVELSGPFMKNLDLSGHTCLSPAALIDMAGGLCVRSAPVVYTQLTAIKLEGCTALTTQSLHGLLIRSPFLHSLNVKGLQAVTNDTFGVLAHCQYLTSLNMSRCVNIDGSGVCAFGGAVIARGARLALKELWLCGLQMVDDDTLATLGKAAPYLEVLDLSYCRSLHNSAVEALVSCTEDEVAFGETILLTPLQAGREPRPWRQYTRRVTALRHLSLSNCTLLTDTACSNLAYSVPRLEFLELAGIGQTIEDKGLVHLLGTTPCIRKLDLEDACDITNAVLEALTPEPPAEAEGSTSSKGVNPPQPGHVLEHLTVSGATNLTDDAFKALIHGCPKLRILEADGTPISEVILKDFVRRVCEQGITDAGLVLVDCRSIGERALKNVAANTRPRKGWRSWEARKLGYLDGRDGEDLKVGQDECDEKRVVIRSYYGWQTVDAVRHVRERKRKANKRSQSALEQTSEPEDGEKLTRTRWWGPGSRMSSGNNTPGEDSGREGCVVM